MASTRLEANRMEAMSTVAAMQGEHQRTLQALAPAVATRSDASMAQLMEMFGPPRLRLENTGIDSSARPAAVLRTSPRHSDGNSERITQLPPSPEVVRATTVEDEDDAEEANE